MLDGVLPFTQVFSSKFRGVFDKRQWSTANLPNRSLLQEQMVVVVGREVGGWGGEFGKRDTRVFMATPQ